MQVYNLEKKYDDSLEAFMRKIFFRVGILWLLLIIAVVLGISVYGCATIDMPCATEGSDTIEIGGSQIGNQVFAAGLGIAKTAGVMAKAPGDATAGPVCHVHYSYFPIWGTDHVTTTHSVPAPTTGTPLNVTVQLAPGTTVTSAPRVVGQSIEEREAQPK